MPNSNRLLPMSKWIKWKGAGTCIDITCECSRSLHVKIGFIPKTKDDFKLLLKLAKCIRLTTKKELIYIINRWEKVRDRND